ncbi:MAG: hypothetical protein RPU34_04080 [Candidatus Sedimenticola sp. (ex Thyasira tokunagai)]
MGKATVTAQNTGAEYDVTIKYDGTYITKKVAKINTRLNEINSVDLPAAQATLTAAETDESVARANYDVAITAFAANPLQLGLREVVEEKKKIWHDSLRPLHLARDAAARIKAERLSLDKHKGWLNSKDIADKTATIWCADLSDGETGRREITSAIDVGTIELFDGDEVLHTIIRPGFTADPTYNPAADGAVGGVANNPAAGWFYNAAINPGWQQHMPKHRAGTITAFNNTDHTATVVLDEVRIGKTGKAAPSQTLSSVPVTYMDCDHWAFDINDRVVVEFNGQKISDPSVIGFIDNPKYCDPGEFWCYPRSDECIAGWGTPFTPLPGTCGTSSPRRKFRRPADDWEQQTFDTDQYIGHVDWRNGNGVTLSWYWSGKSRYEWSWSLAQHVYYNGAQYATIPDAGYGVLGACIKTISSVDKLYIVGYNGLVLKVYQTDFDTPGTYITKLTLDLEALYQTHSNGQIRSTPIYFSESGSEAQFTFTPAILQSVDAIDGTDAGTGEPFHTFASAGMGGCTVKLMKLSIDSAGDVVNTLMTNAMPTVSVIGDYSFSGTYPPETTEDLHYKTSASGQFIVAADYVGESVVYGYMNVELVNEMKLYENKTAGTVAGCDGTPENTTDYYTYELTQKVLTSFEFNNTVIQLQNMDGFSKYIFDRSIYTCNSETTPINVKSEARSHWRTPWGKDGDMLHRSIVGLDMRFGKYATITRHFITNAPEYTYFNYTNQDYWYSPPEWEQYPSYYMELKETVEYMGVEVWASDILKIEAGTEQNLSQETVGSYEWWFGRGMTGIGSRYRKYFPLNPCRLYREWDHTPVGWLPRKWFGPAVINDWRFYNDTSHILEDKIYAVHSAYDVVFPLDSNGLYGRDQEHDAWYLTTPFYTPNTDKGFAASGSDAFLSIKTEEHESQIVSAIKYVNHLTHGDPNDIVGMEEGVNDTNARFYPICNTK